MTTSSKITSHHRDLDRLVGQWQGTEIVRESPDAKPVHATGRFDIRPILQGTFVALDWVEQSKDATLMEGHGVIGWDAKAKEYTLHWFDTFGSPPRGVNTGVWDGNKLTFVTKAETHEGKTTLIHTSDTELAFMVEMKIEGSWLTVIDGRYKRNQ
ncbi:MAG: DUF1579 family protein [Kofleriaceae bacterium]